MGMKISLWHDLPNNKRVEVKDFGESTSNIQIVWEEALHKRIEEFNKSKCAGITEFIKVGCLEIICNRNRFDYLEGFVEGWDTVEDALILLAKLYWACVDYPEAIIYIDT